MALLCIHEFSKNIALLTLTEKNIDDIDIIDNNILSLVY